MFAKLNTYFSNNEVNIPEAPQYTTTVTETSTPIPEARMYTEQELVRNTELAVLSKFQTTKTKWTEFLAFDKATPLQRVLNLTPLKSNMTELMLACVANFEEYKQKRYFYQKDKQYYQDQIEQRMLSFFKMPMPTQSMFLELVYNIYGYYFIAKNGTKEEAMDIAILDAKTEIKAEPIKNVPQSKKEVIVPVAVQDTSNAPKPARKRKWKK
jgi:hypothetical protein